MALQEFTSNGTFTTPGAYAQYQVRQAASGLSTTGVLTIFGEADGGPDFTQEADLGANFYGPTEENKLIAKYGSGRIINAFHNLVTPSNDPQITGTVNGVIVVKTNPSTSATQVINNFASSAYGTLQAKMAGQPGNLIYTQLTAAQTEAVPTTGAFTLLLPIDSTDISVRVNGGAANALTISALEAPPVVVSALNGFTGVSATGGADLATLGSVTGTLALTVNSGNNVTITYSTNWQGTVPVAGATLFIPAASVLASVHANNAGSYQVISATSTQITALKLLDVTGAHNAVTAPIAQTALNVASTTNDLKCYSAVTISNASGNPIDGFGKSLEIASLSTGTGFLPDIAYVGNASATWISTSTNPYLITSAAEYEVTLDETRQSDQVNNLITAGGDVLLKLGYKGTTASAQVTATNLILTFTGGSGTGSPITIPLANYATINDLAAFISAQTGWTATAGTAVLGNQSPTTLDHGTYNCCATWSTSSAPVLPGRIKDDAYSFYTAVAQNGVLVKLQAQASAGLPAPTTAIAFLAGGAKGGTTDANVLAALTAMQKVRCNFVIPLFSQDATLDIAAGLTDPSSSYTIAAIHQNTRSHVLKMSTMKMKRHRQACLSYRGTFSAAQTVAANLNSARCTLNFQDVKDINATTGSINQFQPYMGACIAAAMQGAGGYKSIFNKALDINGAIQAAGDFDPDDPDQVDEAIEAGMLIIQKDEDGELKFVSDQTTYGRDDNFVYNSMQAMYAADTITLTTAKLMQKALVGQSFADISASSALQTLDGIMDQLFKLKLIAFSDDAPRGYKNAVVNITAPSMDVYFEAKEATSLYFVNINFTISQVTQSASG